ncbi:hypothetical protein, partial [Aeromicrobium wangtongii]|uniref:hypothetical protein n=1 Tax=Aeromicrobium wangtongii TaxID=2969247 RepID=UPI00201793AA
MTTSTKYRRLAIGLTAAALLAGGVSAANAGVAEKTPHEGHSATTKTSGWAGITRKQVTIDFGKGWVTKAELTYPTRSKGRLPLVVMLHGSGHNDMNQTLPDDKGAAGRRTARMTGQPATGRSPHRVATRRPVCSSWRTEPSRTSTP